jgi:hypothetical protein
MGTPPVFLVSASIAGKHTLHVAQQTPQRMHGLERERFLPYLFNDGHLIIQDLHGQKVFFKFEN